ncbi:hypothetical protein [Vagococcus fluvialis]|uniref:hypothetical protein n=1 Tax=Vagococcus fluvialis TaxID=2738 RepID=UPI0014334717|nr:hypothetical protein [Vagococcus fluvialis]NKC60302.1 hypothetical protein [Vagococcus fluvialis]NKD51084.1 hypothetical protein [Vagococcus fluvialis]
MRKVQVLLLSIGILLFMTSCSKNTIIKENTSEEETRETSEVKIADASDSELEGVPNNKLSPEVDGKIVDDLTSFNNLNDVEKNKLIKDYLFKSLSGLTTNESETFKLLEEKGYSEQELNNLSEIFLEIQESNPESDFNDLMLKFVKYIMTGEN